MKITKYMPQIIISLLGLAVLLPVLAPIFLEIGWTGPAKFIYTIYIPTCHQKPSRSIHLFDHQLAFCARDTFIYLSLFITSLVSFLFKLKPINWKWLIAVTVPIALDGGIQLVTQVIALNSSDPSMYLESTNLRRMITGTIFASGFGLYLFPLFFEDGRFANGKEIKHRISEFKLFSKTIYWIGWILIINLGVYAFLGYSWDLTSDTYKPSGIIDNVQRFPGKNYEQETRGNHAEYLFDIE